MQMIETETQYSLVKTAGGVFNVIDADGNVVDTGFYDYEGSDDFWMNSGVYAQKADILAFWNNL